MTCLADDIFNFKPVMTMVCRRVVFEAFAG
jgi:hypothetical protein